VPKDVLDSVILSVSINLDARLSIQVVTKLQLTIEAMLRAAADPITDKRHIPYQIIISWNANSMACTSPSLLLSHGDLGTNGYRKVSHAARRASHSTSAADRACNASTSTSLVKDL